MQHMFVLGCPNATQAFDLRDSLVSLQDESLLSLTDAVVVTRDADGKVKLHQAVAKKTGCASAGSVVGVIIGLLFLQPWVGALAGAGGGALAGALLDLGINDQFMKDLGQTLQPGTAAVFLLGRDVQLESLGKRIGERLRGCKILQTTVHPEREAEVQRLLDSL